MENFKDMESLSFFDFVCLCRSKVEVHYFEFLGVVWWRVCYRHNQVVHGKTSMCDADILEWAAFYIQDFGVASEVGKDGEVKLRVSQKWVALSLGSFKINTDAAVNNRDKITSIGVIIRNSLFANLLRGFFNLKLLRPLQF